MESQIRATWKPLYRFDLREHLAIDYEVANWYVSTHPDSHFLYGLMAARAIPGRRYALRNNELTVHHLGGESVRQVLADAAELREVLEGAFGLRLPDGPELDAVLTRLTAPVG
jgi:N-hydroxyarylamine O-acetyltransferase